MTRPRRRPPQVPSLLGILLVASVACTSGDAFDPLPRPEGTVAPETSTTTRPDFSGMALAPVAGTTSTTEVVVGPGPSTVAGRVDGPDGPVPEATVRVERLVGDQIAAVDVFANLDGLWQAPAVHGGRYRVRAWRAPDLAMVEPQILFVGAGQTAELALAVERFDARAVDAVIAPDPPRVGAPANLLVRLSAQTVDDDGVVRATPSAGLEVVLSPGSGWAARSPLRQVTGSTGSATFTLVCRAPGPQPLVVSIPAAVDDPPPPPPGAPPAPGGGGGGSSTAAGMLTT
ncbi:MAG TPA: hypothetical protein VNT56_07505, partial [Acidimicrobiales bacterium]|nr:hypothetical protein [Acidimicrobiales bacterium]